MDIIVEFEKGKKNIHSFLGLKRLLEDELGCKVDLGIESSLKQAVKDAIEGHILYA